MANLHLCLFSSCSISIMCHMKKLCREKYENQDRIRCNDCGSSISVRKDKTRRLEVDNAVSHACIHLSKYLFSCNHCPHRTVAVQAMRTHLYKAHRLGSNKENYVNHMPDHRQEIIQVIDRCFRLVHPGMASTEVDSKTKSVIR